MKTDIPSLPDALSCPAIAVDAHGRIEALNAAMAGLLGHAREALTGQALAAYLADPGPAVTAATLAEDKATELRIRAGDGSERRIALRLAAADAHLAVAIAFDMTAVRAEEQRLREEAARYLDMATAGSDTLHESIGIWDDTGGTLRLWGARRNDGTRGFRERLVRFPDDVVDMTYRPEVLSEYFELIAGRKPYKNVIYRLLRDDREIYARVSAVPFYDANGEYRGYRGISIDVTKQVLAEEALEKKDRELEAAARELAKARDAAVRASEAKSAFLANMSHELRTPLNAIIGFAEMIEGRYLGEIPERYRTYGGDIHASGLHLLELINQILDLSKIEAGRMELHESEFFPADILSSCRRLLEDRANAAGVVLRVETAPGLPALHADELKFKQIVLNLVSNAIKFTASGGTVTVTTAMTAHGLALEVKDTGVGMRPEEIPLALEPFRQVGDETRRKQQGTGLGLPLAKAFAELHGGTFVIESEHRKGTTVTVVFPEARVSGGDKRAGARVSA